VLSSSFSSSPLHAEKNYGTLEIFWEEGSVLSRTHNESGHVIEQIKIFLKDMQFKGEEDVKWRDINEGKGKGSGRPKFQCWPEKRWYDMSHKAWAAIFLLLLSLLIFLLFAFYFFLLRPLSRTFFSTSSSNSSDSPANPREPHQIPTHRIKKD